MTTSNEHEALVDLLRDPTLVRALLRAGGVRPKGKARVADMALATPELRADLVAVFGPEKAPKLAVVVEVQRDDDEDKPFTWPHYEEQRGRAIAATHACSWSPRRRDWRDGLARSCALGP